LAELLQFPLDNDGNRVDVGILEVVSNNKICYALYRTFNYDHYGRLGEKYRIK